MAREILFRGKRMDNGEWVEGYYTCIGDKFHYILVGKLDIANGYPNFEHYWVNSETVGQYTGLTDKNSKKIFEGDIVKTKKYGKIIGHSNVNDYDIFKIVYVPAMFILENHHRGFNLVGNGEDYEVIGNIHDNPELLEAQECEQQN